MCFVGPFLFPVSICLAPPSLHSDIGQLARPTLSSRGLGHRPFTAVTRVRIPLGSQLIIRRWKLTGGALATDARINGDGSRCQAGGLDQAKSAEKPMISDQLSQPTLLGPPFRLKHETASSIAACPLWEQLVIFYHAYSFNNYCGSFCGCPCCGECQHSRRQPSRATPRFEGP